MNIDRWKRINDLIEQLEILERRASSLALDFPRSRLPDAVSHPSEDALKRAAERLRETRHELGDVAHCEVRP